VRRQLIETGTRAVKEFSKNFLKLRGVELHVGPSRFMAIQFGGFIGKFTVRGKWLRLSGQVSGSSLHRLGRGGNQECLLWDRPSGHPLQKTLVFCSVCTPSLRLSNALPWR
jgi:hypothetical protein